MTDKRMLLCFAAILVAFAGTVVLSNTETVTTDFEYGQLSCKVTSNQIIVSYEGKYTEYQGAKGGFETGDALLFEYIVCNDRLSLALMDKIRDQDVASVAI